MALAVVSSISSIAYYRPSHAVMACVVMAYIVMAYIVMVYVVMAYIVMAVPHCSPSGALRVSMLCKEIDRSMLQSH